MGIVSADHSYHDAVWAVLDALVRARAPPRRLLPPRILIVRMVLLLQSAEGEVAHLCKFHEPKFAACAATTTATAAITASSRCLCAWCLPACLASCNERTTQVSCQDYFRSVNPALGACERARVLARLRGRLHRRTHAATAATATAANGRPASFACSCARLPLPLPLPLPLLPSMLG